VKHGSHILSVGINFVGNIIPWNVILPLCALGIYGAMRYIRNTCNRELRAVNYFLPLRFLVLYVNVHYYHYHNNNNNNYYYYYYSLTHRVPGYRPRGPGFDSRCYQIFWEVVGLERGPFSLVRIIEEILQWKSSGSGQGNRINDRRDPLRWPR
jgi:hypothetical protein